MNRKIGFVVLALAVSSLLVPVLSQKKSQDAFVLGDTVAIAVCCLGAGTSPEQAEFQIVSPEVEEIIKALSLNDWFNAVNSGGNVSVVLWLKDNKGAFKQGYLIFDGRAIAFKGELRHAFWLTKSKRATEILLAVKPDCTK